MKWAGKWPKRSKTDTGTSPSNKSFCQSHLAKGGEYSLDGEVWSLMADTLVLLTYWRSKDNEISAWPWHCQPSPHLIVATPCCDTQQWPTPREGWSVQMITINNGTRRSHSRTLFSLLAEGYTQQGIVMLSCLFYHVIMSVLSCFIFFQKST